MQKVFGLEWSIPIPCSARRLFAVRFAEKTVKVQYFLMMLFLLQAFLQNGRNFSHLKRSSPEYTQN